MATQRDEMSRVKLDLLYKESLIVLSFIACSHRRHGQDKTVLSVSAVWTQLATRQDSFVCLDPVSCNCSVWHILRTTENLKIGNWVDTRQDSLVLSPVVFTLPTRTRQHSLVLSVSAMWTRHHIFSPAGWAYQISWSNALSVCVCVWMLTRVEQISTAAHEDL